MKLQRNILCFFSCFLFGVAQAKNVDFKLEAVPLPKAVGMIYDEVLEKPYMLDPKLAADTRLISFHTKEDQDFNQFITRYFENMNIKTYEKNGVVYLAHIEPKPPKIIKHSFVYNPVHRDTEYLAQFLQGEGQVSASGDKLVYYGTAEDIARIKSVLKSVDTPSREVVVTGYVFEVQDIAKEGSGINLLAKVVSSPTLRVKSGSKGNFSVGSDVPVLSNVTYQDGRPIQSIEYRSSGVIFDIQPTIKSNAIDLKINQQLSNFVKTDTGVNQSPTLIKRDIVTDVTLKSGDIVVLGGLAENKLTEGETGFSFLPKGFLTGKSKSNTKTDIVILLQVKMI